MRRKIDEKNFELVKIMTAGGADIATIAAHLGISSQTISRCRKADDFTGYKALTTAEGRKSNARRKAKQEPAPAPTPAQEPAPTPTLAPIRVNAHINDTAILTALREQNELLKLISRKLVFIVEQLS